MANKKLYSRSNSLGISADLDYAFIHSGNTKICYDLKRARALARWKRVQSQLENASLAFSTNRQEYRRAFTNRRWFSISEMEHEATPKRQRSSNNSGSTENNAELQELLPQRGHTSKSGSSVTRRRTTQAVSFEEDTNDDRQIRREHWRDRKR